MLLSLLFCGFIVNLPTLQSRDGWFTRSGFAPQYLSFLYYLNELMISDEMLGKTVTIKSNLQSTRSSQQLMYDVAGEEILAHLGYALNCSRIWGADELACWYDILVPIMGVIVFIATAALALAFCVQDPH